MTTYSSHYYTRSTIRQKIAQGRLEATPFCTFPSNTAEEIARGESAGYTTSFHKALNHNVTTGRLVNASDYTKLVSALNTLSEADMALVPVATTGKLANPVASFATALIGDNSEACRYLVAPPGGISEQRMYEMVVAYLRFHTKTVEFTDYGTAGAVSDAINLFNQIPATNREAMGFGTTASTPATFLRAVWPGARKGPFVSLFLTEMYTSDTGVVMMQEYPQVDPVLQPRMATRSVAIAAQNGVPDSATMFNTSLVPITNGVQLTEYVHRDVPGRIYDVANTIMVQSGAPVNPFFQTPANQDAFVTKGGVCDVVSSLYEGARTALLHAWVHKWRRWRVFRPEAWGILMDLELNSLPQGPGGAYVFPSAIRTNTVLTDTLMAVNGSTTDAILRQSYPEGSPSHPSYPAGHAVVSGMCATILKAYYNADVEWPAASAAAGETVTYSEELNKLALNIAQARNTAGVHYESDGTFGLLLGEQIAMSFIADIMATRPKSNLVGVTSDTLSVKFTDFQGVARTITPTVKTTTDTSVTDRLTTSNILLIILVVLFAIASIAMLLYIGSRG